MTHHNSTIFDELPATAFVRQAQLIPTPVPFSAATLWRKCKSGEFPKPIKLSAGITAWRVGEVRAWLASQGANVTPEAAVRSQRRPAKAQTGIAT